MTKSNSIVVFGATGKTGKEIIKKAILLKIYVKAVVRKVTDIEKLPDNVDVAICDTNNINQINAAIRNTTAVVIVFGPKPPYKDVFCYDATKNIIHSMEKLGVKRLICQTGAMIGDYPKNRSFLFSLFSKSFKKNNPAGYKDRVDQENIIKNSTLDWTIIKPPRLTDSNKTGVKASTNVKAGIMSTISRKGLAGLIVEDAIKPQHLKKIVFVKNK